MVQLHVKLDDDDDDDDDDCLWNFYKIFVSFVENKRSCRKKIQATSSMSRTRYMCHLQAKHISSEFGV